MNHTEEIRKNSSPETEKIHSSIVKDTEIAYRTRDGYFAIQTATEGYDYTIYDKEYHGLDGGVLDDTELSIWDAIADLMEDTGISLEDCERIDYEELQEKAEAAAQEELLEKAEAVSQEELRGAQRENQVSGLTGDVKYFELMQAIEMSSPAPIRFGKVEGGIGRYNDENKEITIQEGMSELLTIETAVHEVGHAILHNIELTERLGRWKDEAVREVEAESFAFVVCQYLGINTMQRSFPYIARWSNDMEPAELEICRRTVKIAFRYFIEALEENIRSIQEGRTEVLALEEDDLMLKITDPAADGFSFVVVEDMGKEELLEKLNDYHGLYGERAGMSAGTFLEEQGARVTLWYDSQGLMMEHPVDFFDLEYVYGTGVRDAAELPLMEQVRMSMNRTEYGKTIFDERDKELIIDYASKIKDIGRIKGFIKEFAQRLEMFCQRAPGRVQEKMMFSDAAWGGPMEYKPGLEAERSGQPVLPADGKWEKNRANEDFFLNSGENCFAIYQIDTDSNGRAYQYMGMETMWKYHLSIDRADYRMVYCDALKEGDTIDSLFERFNMAHPDDFHGISMFVSDVVAFNRDGKVKTYYVDSFGFTELRGFVKEKERENVNTRLEKAGTKQSVLQALRMRQARLKEQEKRPGIKVPVRQKMAQELC